MNRFDNKVVIVTGASGGLGKTTAIEFAKENAKVIPADIADKSKEIADELNQEGHPAFFIKTNFADENDVKNLVSQAVKHFEKLDVMFANAGINIESTVEKLESNDWQKIIDVNLKSVYLCNKYAIQQFKKQGNGGAIIGEPTEVARTVLFLASDDASFISSVTLQIDGGYTAV